MKEEGAAEGSLSVYRCVGDLECTSTMGRFGVLNLGDAK